MTKTMQRFADGMLSRLVPKVEVAAGCVSYQTCRCEGYVRFLRKCYTGCPGMRNSCGPCNITSTC